MTDDNQTGLARAKPVSYLERFQNYAINNPLQNWFLTAGFMLALYAAGLLAFPGARKQGFICMVLGFAFGPPTATLLRRFSKEAQAKNPIFPQQEQAVGVISVLAAFGSVISFFIVLFGRRVGLPLSSDAALFALFGYAFSLMLGLAFGIAAQNTKAGRLVRTASAWVGLLIGAAFVSFLRERFR